MLDRREGHLAMRYHRGDDAHEIDIIASDQGSPIALDVRDVEFTRHFFRVFASRAGDRGQTRAFAIRKAGNLRRPRKACADDADANSLFHNVRSLRAEYVTNFTLSSKFIDLP